MRVLLVGGSGQLGSEILRSWTDCRIDAPSSAALPVEDERAFARTLDAGDFSIVVNCAAFHNVDRCEAQAERAFAVNALAVDAMARACRDRELAFVTISTDYVFDGRAVVPYVEEDAARPISAYGASKLAGELLVERLQMRAFVVRTCGLYATRVSSSKGYTFVDRIVEQARAGEPVRVVDDTVASPTYAAHLAAALRALVATQAYGLYHASDVGPVSWFDFAAHALELAGTGVRPEPISSSQWKNPARRPQYSALSSSKLAALGIEMPSWHQGLADYMRDRS